MKIKNLRIDNYSQLCQLANALTFDERNMCFFCATGHCKTVGQKFLGFYDITVAGYFSFCPVKYPAGISVVSFVVSSLEEYRVDCLAFRKYIFTIFIVCCLLLLLLLIGYDL